LGWGKKITTHLELLYHASQAGDLDAANAIISEVYEYLRQWKCAELVCANLPLPLLTEVKNITL